jgi:hypothetical protein
MTTRVLTLVTSVALISTACYVGDEPLSPPVATRDARILGEWRCVSPAPDGDEPAVIRVTPFESVGYDLEFGERGKDPDRYRGYSSLVSGHVVLNLQEVHDGKANKAWMFARYDLLRPNVVQVRLIADRLLKTLDSPKAVTEAIRRNIANPDLYDDFCVCVRVQSK